MAAGALGEADLERELLILTPVLPRHELVPDRTALLTIDMQYLDAHPDFGVGRRARDAGRMDLLQPYFDGLPAVVSNIKALQAAARRAGVENVHIFISPHTEDARDTPPVSRLGGARSPRSSRDNAILEDLVPPPGELVLSKISSNAFLSTDLNLILRNMRIDTLICCGVVTNGCVESTSRNARDLGYQVIVASDATASWTSGMHERTLRRIATTVGNVRTTADIVASLPSAGE